MRLKFKIISLVTLALIPILAFSACADIERVAQVNGESISKQEFQEQLEMVKTSYQQEGQDLNTEENQDRLEQVKQQLLDIMIDNVILRQKAEEQGITVDSQVLEEQIKGIKSQFNNEKEYQQALEEHGLTESDLEEDISNEMLIEKYLKNEISESDLAVSKSEINNYYEQLKAQYPEGEAPAIEELEPQIVDFLTQQKHQNAKNELLERLRTEADIEIFL